MIDNEQYLKKVISHYLSDAPTLSGLPLEFLPSDIIPMKNKGYIRLDFTSSEDFKQIVNTIYKDIDRHKVVEIMEGGHNFENELLELITYTYHKDFYNKIHLKSKNMGAKFLMNTVNNNLTDISMEDKDKFLDEYKIRDKFYDRGLIDYDYSLLGVTPSTNKFRENVKLKVIEARDKFINENNLIKTELKNQGVSEVTNDKKQSIEKIIYNDTKNLYYLKERILKIQSKNKEFYKEQSKDKNSKSLMVKTRIGNIPVFMYESIIDKRIKIYFTSFSAYIVASDKVYVLYHVGRNTLVDCDKLTNMAIQKFNFPTICIEHPNALPLR